MRNPAMPIRRMNGRGSATSVSKPIATAAPEKSTARPAVSMVRTIASSVSSVRVSSSRKR